MGRHRRTVHGCLLHPSPGKAAKGPKVCCDEVFVTLYEYARHRESKHDDGHLCPVCGRIFPRRSHLARHSFVHSGLKPYGCGLCGHASAVFSNMERHVGTAKCRRNAERIAAGLVDRPKPKGVRFIIPDVPTMIAARALLELGRQGCVFKPDRPSSRRKKRV
ncbi:hypothetical protein MTO96_017239 [Rhipicephalus appendiculatus]